MLIANTVIWKDRFVQGTNSRSRSLIGWAGKRRLHGWFSQREHSITNEIGRLDISCIALEQHTQKQTSKSILSSPALPL